MYALINVFRNDPCHAGIIISRHSSLQVARNAATKHARALKKAEQENGSLAWSWYFERTIKDKRQTRVMRVCPSLKDGDWVKWDDVLITPRADGPQTIID